MPRWLNETTPQFPPSSEADDEGLLAIGGNLAIETLITAYQKGIFPWFEQDSPILWWSPDPRLVLYPDAYQVSKSLRKILHKTNWTVSLNCAFADVISACARTHLASSTSNNTWITSTMHAAYIALHQAGFAHSIEIFENNNLIGGLYGIAIGKMFFGESMFSRKSNASKVALYHLCTHLRQYQFPLIDCQVESAHLVSLGAQKIPRADFTEQVLRLSKVASEPQMWQPQTLVEIC